MAGTRTIHHIAQSSVAGEEDPGASADVVAALLRNKINRQAFNAQPPHIEIDCIQGSERIAVGVSAQGSSQSTSKLLALVVVHHSAIADAAWGWCKRTGSSLVEIEVGEGADGGVLLRRKPGPRAALEV